MLSTRPSPHDTVYIASGEYNEHIEIPESTTHLGFIGIGYDSTYIWLDTMSILKEKLGPLLIQFPYGFKPEMSDNLFDFFENPALGF